ncbi:helix-turn-helix transcriptional regulator [Natronococcus wangiae]|uniref:helix-turn-helix transcriptional regulator n=1 Tax=Natronococcus wangiae TaxID=3068275 RepID=UPI00273F2B21|nr:ABC transporter permease [Natronococcus sp. AD5]
MRLSAAVTLALVVLLAASLPGTVAAASLVSAPASTAHAPAEAHASTPATADVNQPAVGGQSSPTDADPAQVIRINVTADGDAEWTIESRFLLTDDEDVEAFSEYADAVRSGDRDAAYDRDLFEPHVGTAEETTDREMSIEDDGWEEPRIESPDDEDVENDAKIGVLSYSFTWTNFATVDDGRIYFGDAFQTADGPWLSMLDDDQRLVVQSPPNYGFHDYNLPVSPQDGALIIDGPYQFSDDELEVVFLRGAGVDDGSGPINGFLLPSVGWLVGGLFFLVLAVGTTSYVLARQSTDHERPIELPLERVRVPWSNAEDDETTGETDPRGGAGAASEARSPPELTPATADRLDESSQEFAYDEADDEEVDPELLSDEERVLRLLRRNGGRMKQASIVTETGWSNAKVSQLLSKMDDDEEIEKLRIGRENLITLPEIDPTELD